MGVRHHEARHGASYGHSCKQSLLSRANTYHMCVDAKVQPNTLRNTFSVEDVFALSEQSFELPLVERFKSILHNCLEEKKLANAWRLYMHILANGLETSDIFSEDLLHMFVECGSASAAEQFFHRFALDNVHAWAYSVKLLVNHGEFQQAIDLSKKLDADFARPDRYFYQLLLKACSSIKCIEQGWAIHCRTVKKGYDHDPFIGSALLDMYAKCGLLGEMQIVFDGLSFKDVVSWTALIFGYAENGFGEEALQGLLQMQSEGVFPNAVTFVCSLKACGVIGDIDKGREIHAELAKEGYDEDCHVGSALMSVYIKYGSLEEAQDVFNELPYKDVILWTALIGGYAENGYGKEALACLKKMQVDGFYPNAVTSVCCLKACGSLGSCLKGRWLHIEITKKGFDSDSYVNTALVDMYMKCGSIAEAEEVFDKLPFKNLVLWNALIAGYADHKCGQEAMDSFERLQFEGLSPDAVTLVCTLKACIGSEIVHKGRILHTKIAEYGFEKEHFVRSSLLDMYSKWGLLEEAQHVFDELPAWDVVSWNVLIAGYVEHGFGEEALFLLEKMHEKGVPIDAITSVCGLKACVVLGALDRGRWIHMQALKQALIEEDTIIGSALVDMYAKCNSLADARVSFNSLSSQGVVSWGTLLLGFASQGEDEFVFRLFDNMVESGMQPDGISFLSVLTVCSHAGLLEKGFRVFTALSRDDAIPTTVEHYNCMVDLLGRAGQLDAALATLNEMPLQPNIVSWSTLLGSCRKCHNVELARQSFTCAASLKEKKGAVYILMAGIYADNSMWQDIEQLEEMLMNF